MKKLGYKEWLGEITNELAVLTVTPDIAASKARSFRGTYYNETKYREPHDIVLDVIKKAPITDFSDAGVYSIKNKYGVN